MVVEAFRKLRNAVRGEDGRTKAQGYLKPIDVDEIVRDIDLPRIASERGKQELPSCNAVTLDAVEQQITQTLEGEWAWHGAELINNLRAYAARLISFSISTELANLRLEAQNTLAKLRNAHHRAEAELGPLRENYTAYRDELADFKQEHRLRRAARPPTRRYTTLGLLVLLAGVEAGFNGVFFAKGASLGLVGGVGTALGISFVNVVTSFAVGLFPMRWVNHRNILIKLIGGVLSLAAVAALISLHGFAAHYRDAMALVGEDRAFETARHALVATPMMLADLNSFYLFGLGLVLSAVGIWKGYTFDDPYPRYGAHSRRAADAREDYSDEHAVLFEDLENIKEKTVEALDAGIRRIPQFPQQSSKIRAQREAELRSFQAYETGIEAAVNRLLAIYRDGNRVARQTEPPAYFSTTWKLSRSFLKDTAVLTEIADPTAPPLDANAALEELRTLSADVIGEYETLLVKYPHPTEMPR
jgi:hypothetical protein